MLPRLFRQVEDWSGVADEALRIVRDNTEKVALLRASCWGLPRLRHHVLLQPYSGQVHVCLSKDATDTQVEAWEERFDKVGFHHVTGSPLDVPPPGYGEEPWVWVKQASDPVVSFLAKALNYQPSLANKIIGGPSPLAATLASGAFGAGLGFLGGAAAESFLPERDFEPGKLRRNMALAGAAIGAAPGVLWGLSSMEGHPNKPGLRAWLSSWPYRSQDIEGEPLTPENSPVKKALASLQGQLSDLKPEDYLDKEAFVSESPLGQGVGLLNTLPVIQKDEFGRVVFQDPNTPPPIQAATVGLVNTAANATGRSYINPYDIARISAGGLARGLFVGKTLGALAGLRPEAQQELQRIGLWSSLLTAVVPNAFPDNSRLFPAY